MQKIELEAHIGDIQNLEADVVAAYDASNDADISMGNILADSAFPDAGRDGLKSAQDYMSQASGMIERAQSALTQAREALEYEL